jgi:hypothetical protein
MPATQIKPEYFSKATFAEIWNDWNPELKEWVRKFFEGYGNSSEAWDSPHTMNCPFLTFEGGIILRQNKEDVGGDCGLVLITVYPPMLVKQAKVANIDELLRTVDPHKFARKCVASHYTKTSDPDFIDYNDFLVEFYVTRLLCEETGWNIGMGMAEIKDRRAAYIFNSHVDPSPFQKLGEEETVRPYQAPKAVEGVQKSKDTLQF